jgi:magnesium chelatase family protein
MGPQLIRKFCPVSTQSDEILRAAIDRLGLSARAYHRVLKVARTIADLEDKESIQPSHITEAVQYRTLDRTAW